MVMVIVSILERVRVVYECSTVSSAVRLFPLVVVCDGIGSRHEQCCLVDR